MGLIALNGMGAIAGLITARTLGKEAVGVLAVSFGIGEFGRAISACTHIPSIVEYHAAKYDERTIFWSSFVVKLVASALFVGAVALASMYVESAFHVPAFLLILATSVLILGTGYEVGAARLEAQNRMIRSNLVLGTGSVVSLLLVAFLAFTHQLTLVTSVLATLSANVCMSIAAYTFSRPRGAPHVKPALAWAMTKYGLRIVSAGLLTQGLLWTDTLLVSYLRGNGDAGVYNVVFYLTLVMVTASNAMGVALVPALSKLHGEGKDTRFAYQRGTLIALGLSVTIALAEVLLGRFILGLYGAAFVEGYPMLLVLTLFGVSAALAVPAATMLTIHRRAGLLSLLSLSQLVVNVPLGWFLIGRFGLMGAALATTSIFLVGMFVLWFTVRRVTGAWPFSRAAFHESWQHARRLLGRRQGQR